MKMQFIFFTKMVRDQPIARLIETLKSIGADGADLTVRPGYPVNPDNVRAVLPGAVGAMRDAGLTVPMVTAPTDMIDPESRVAADLWAACHDARVPHIKVGYWSYSGKDYWATVDRARKAIEGFERMATRYGVKACLHTHSGNYVGLNASSVMHLARGFNPAAVGVYLDPGHLAVNGEPLTMAVDMAGEYLSLIAVKDSMWAKTGGEPPREAHFLPLGQGGVDWRELIRVLLARGYAGPLSFHSEYETLKEEAIVAQTKEDIAYLRRVEQHVRSSDGDGHIRSG